jgi:hypothetical protein
MAPSAECPGGNMKWISNPPLRTAAPLNAVVAGPSTSVLHSQTIWIDLGPSLVPAALPNFSL